MRFQPWQLRLRVFIITTVNVRDVQHRLLVSLLTYFSRMLHACISLSALWRSSPYRTRLTKTTPRMSFTCRQCTQQSQDTLICCPKLRVNLVRLTKFGDNVHCVSKTSHLRLATILTYTIRLRKFLAVMLPRKYEM